ncbi:MAG: hypothetical protein QM820_10675 [Minicystis sp.]
MRARARLRFALAAAALASGGCHGDAFLLHAEGTCVVTAKGDAGPDTIAWTRELGLSGHPQATAVGALGEIAVAGAIEGGECFVAALESSGLSRWTRRWPGRCSFSALAFGSDGRLVTMGILRDTLTIDHTTVRANGDADVLVTSWSPGGALQWAQALGGRGDDVPGAVAVEDSGDVHAALQIADRAVIGDVPRDGMVVATLAGLDGAVRSSLSLGLARPVAIALDASERGAPSTVVAGLYEEVVHVGFDAAQQEIILRKPGAHVSGKVLFLARIAGGRTPNLTWARNVARAWLGADWYSIATSLAVDRTGALAVMANELAYDDRPNGRTATVTKLDRLGNPLWSRCFALDPGGMESSNAITFADDGTVWAAGNTQRGWSYRERGGPFFLVHYGASGQVLSSSVHQRGDKMAAGSVAVDKLGRALAATMRFHGKSDEQPPDDVVVTALGR